MFIRILLICSLFLLSSASQGVTYSWRNALQVKQYSDICPPRVRCKVVKNVATGAALAASNSVTPMAPIVVKSPWSDIEADMGINEATLLNAPVGPLWAVRGLVDMGVPRGDATRSYFQPKNQALKSSAYWNATVAWFQIWPGTLHTATNVRVKISAITMYVLSKSTGRWVKICTGSPTWSKIQPPGTGKANVRIEPDGTPSFKLDASFHPIHGGLAKYAMNGSDVAAAFAEVTSELILDNPNGKDDRASAQLLVQAGVDYYPSTASQISDFAPMNYAPGSGSGRFGIVGSTPRKHYFVSIDQPGNTNNPKSVFQQNGGVVAIPQVQFEANMPPVSP